jgi:hypothetical protein
VHVDNKVLERILIERQVDAIMGFGSSSLPVILSKGVRGIRLYMPLLASGVRNRGDAPHY